MSQKAEVNDGDSSTDIKANPARRDVCDFLAERSELQVEFEEIKVPDGTAERPVARTHDSGEKADVSDFPSGKSDDKGNFSKKTFVRYRDVLSDFLESRDVTDLMDLEPRDVSRWNKRLQRQGYARTTRDGKLQTLEKFFKWAEREFRAPKDEYRLSETLEGKRKDLAVSQSEKSRAGDENHVISQDRAERILSDLARHDYASRQMVEFLLIYRIGCRQSALRAINVDDIDSERGVIKIRNRPEETGVRLKKGNNGERDVNVSGDVLNIVEEYINHKRKEPQDGSEALLTSAYGRIDESTLYRDITGVTMCGDCTYSDVLSDDKIQEYRDDDDKPDPSDTLTKQQAHKCDESIGCHDLRRTAITVMKDKGLSWDAIAGRVNATVDMLQKHYDSPTHKQAAERREAEVRRLLDEKPGE